jgi:hypothetical protein
MCTLLYIFPTEGRLALYNHIYMQQQIIPLGIKTQCDI